MKIEYDSKRDLLYICLSTPKKVAKTITIVPGIFSDFDGSEKLIGLEILDASEVIDNKLEFDLSQIIKVS